MNSIISATTGATVGASPRRHRDEVFLANADHLLRSAHNNFAQGRYDLALEEAYRAALRVAGAVNFRSSVIQKRKRLPTSAWDKLAITSQKGKEWAAELRRFSALRGRVASGVVDSPSRARTRELLDLAQSFFDYVDGGEIGPDSDLGFAA